MGMTRFATRAWERLMAGRLDHIYLALEQELYSRERENEERDTPELARLREAAALVRQAADLLRDAR